MAKTIEQRQIAWSRWYRKKINGADGPAYLAKRRKQNKKNYEQGHKAPVGTCEICSKANIKLCQDHCHVTDKLRGRICQKCNLMLGHAEDCVDTLRKAADYLERYN